MSSLIPATATLPADAARTRIGSVCAAIFAISAI
ncbi:hypothetical protein FHW08_002256 [Pantoea agglomerans]|nr:hypothetical protein [Pantoea agglomerans]MBA8874142.1 hypothetical protein [Pantoea agglomerans]